MNNLELQPFYHDLKNEIQKPERIVVTSRYFLDKWVPLLKPIVTMAIIIARKHCYYNKKTGEKRNTTFISQETWAREIGVSKSTLFREFKKCPYLSKFLKREPRYKYDPVLKKTVRTSDLIHVAMDDPLIPQDEEMVRKMIIQKMIPQTITQTPEKAEEERKAAESKVIQERVLEVAKQALKNVEVEPKDEEVQNQSGQGIDLNVNLTFRSKSDEIRAQNFTLDTPLVTKGTDLNVNLTQKEILYKNNTFNNNVYNVSTSTINDQNANLKFSLLKNNPTQTKPHPNNLSNKTFKVNKKDVNRKKFERVNPIILSIANEIAKKLNDTESLPWYVRIASICEANNIRETLYITLSEVKELKDLNLIKTTPKQCFTYLIKEYLKNKGINPHQNLKEARNEVERLYPRWQYKPFSLNQTFPTPTPWTDKLMEVIEIKINESFGKVVHKLENLVRDMVAKIREEKKEESKVNDKRLHDLLQIIGWYLRNTRCSPQHMWQTALRRGYTEEEIRKALDIIKGDKDLLRGLITSSSNLDLE